MKTGYHKKIDRSLLIWGFTVPLGFVDDFLQGEEIPLWGGVGPSHVIDNTGITFILGGILTLRTPIFRPKLAFYSLSYTQTNFTMS